MTLRDTTAFVLNGGKNFEGPWQAQAFAMVVRLNAVGRFTWDEWVRTFSDEITSSPALADESPNQAYYRQWVAALERLLIQCDIVADGDVEERADVWRRAYLNTPHGQPIEMANADCPPPHRHDHVTRGVPIAVSPASAFKQSVHA